MQTGQCTEAYNVSTVEEEILRMGSLTLKGERAGSLSGCSLALFRICRYLTP